MDGSPHISTAAPSGHALGQVVHARSEAESATEVVRELAAELQAGPEPVCMVAIHGPSATFEDPGFAAAVQHYFRGIPVIGCTTAGELGAAGYVDGGAVGYALRGDAFRVVTTVLTGLRGLAPDAIRREAADLMDAMQRMYPDIESSRCFALLMVDGLSMAEETTAYNLQAALGDIPLVGGSAGDALRFQETRVLHNGEVHTDAAVLAVVESRLPFRVFKAQHIQPTETKLVVTGAEPERRRLTELHGMPAAECLANTLGVGTGDLGPDVFAQHPVLLRMGGQWFVRSLQQVEEDGSLTAYCAIDEGLVLTVGNGPAEALSVDLERTLQGIDQELGGIHAVLGFDCILRRLQALAEGQAQPLQQVFQRYNVVGFNTYGEQLGPTHINQTFTGVAFGN